MFMRIMEPFTRTEDKKMKKLIALFLAVCCAAGCMMLAACKTDDNTDEKTFTVATNTPFDPFEYIGTDGLAYGIDMEIAAGFAASKGYKLVIRDIDFKSILANVASGYADIGMAGMTISEDRLVTNDFTDTYYTASQKLIVLATDTAFDGCTDAASVEAVLKTLTKDDVLAFQNGTTGNWYVEGDADWEFEGFANATAKGYESAQQAVMDMVNGNVRGVVVDDAPASMLAKAQNGKVKVIDIALTSEEYAFALQKGNDTLKADFNAYLASIKADGTLDAIIAKYFGGEGTKVGYTVSDN